MGIKICVLKNVTQQKNQFWKRPTITWIIAKKLLKNRVWGHSTIFNQFFVHKSWQSHSFSKRIVFLSHIFQDTNFDTHNSLFWEKKNVTPKRGPRNFQVGVGPLKKKFFKKQIFKKKNIFKKKFSKKLPKNCRRQFFDNFFENFFFLNIFFFENFFFEKFFLLCQIFCSANFSDRFCSRTNLRNRQSKSTASYDVM